MFSSRTVVIKKGISEVGLKPSIKDRMKIRADKSRISLMRFSYPLEINRTRNKKKKRNKVHSSSMPQSNKKTKILNELI
jgi:hypothetical protein